MNVTKERPLRRSLFWRVPGMAQFTDIRAAVFLNGEKKLASGEEA